MKALYSGAIDILVFFFTLELFGSILKVGNGTFYQELVFAIVFAGLMYIVPHVLLFFKISASTSTEFLLSALFSFLFFFVGYYALNFVDVSNTVFDAKIPILQPINFADKMVVLAAVGVFTAILSAGIQYLNKKKRKSSTSLSY